MEVLFVASEMAPFIKTGGLGDVVGSLPFYLKKQGVDVKVILPFYKQVNTKNVQDLSCVGTFDIEYANTHNTVSLYHATYSGLDVYFIQNEHFYDRDYIYGFGDDYERFAFFCRAVMELLKIRNYKPNLIHLHDWQTALLSVYLKDTNDSFFDGIKTLFTIHNMQYQGVFPHHVLNSIGLDNSYFDIEKLEYYGGINFMKGGLLYSDYISTVSKTYAKEIMTQKYGYGLDGVVAKRQDKLRGIVNGIDFENNNPKTNKNIWYSYSKDDFKNKKKNKEELQKELGLNVSDVPLVAIISRLVDQKGFDILRRTLLDKNAQLVVLGTGDRIYEYKFEEVAKQYPGQISVNLFFDPVLADKIYAGSDMFLMPSLFEPCGLGQLFAMRYGSIPIVRDTGGLSDTVSHFTYDNKSGNGIVFNDYLTSAVDWAVNYAINLYEDKDTWNVLVKNALSYDSSWDSKALEYIKLYEEIISDTKLGVFNE